MAKKKQWKEPEATAGGEPEPTTGVSVTEEPEADVTTETEQPVEPEKTEEAPRVEAAVSTTVPTKTVTVYPNYLQVKKITVVGPLDPRTSSRQLTLADGTDVVANAAALSGYQPSVGDYYLVPNEGNPYCAAKSTFALSYTVAF